MVYQGEEARSILAISSIMKMVGSGPGGGHMETH
jgi:hypothetical protein